MLHQVLVSLGQHIKGLCFAEEGVSPTIARVATLLKRVFKVSVMFTQAPDSMHGDA